MKFVSISDIDQLVLGYIAEQRYFQTRNKLFDESPYLPARVPILQLFGDISSENRLQTILEEYVSLKNKEESTICAICNECDSLTTLWEIFDKVSKKIKKSHLALNSRIIQHTETTPAAHEDEIVGMQRLSPLELYHNTATSGNASAIERKRLNPVSNEYESATPEKNKQSGSAKRKSNMLPKRNRVPVQDEDLTSLLHATDPSDALALVGVKILSNMKKCVGKGNFAPQEIDLPADPPLEETHAAATNPQTTGPSLDIQDLITDETRDGLVEMTIDSLMNSAVTEDIVPPCDLPNSSDDFLELRKLLDCRPTASCGGTGFDNYMQNQQDERDLMEIIKEDDIPDQPSTTAPSLLLYNPDEKATVTDVSSVQNPLNGDGMLNVNSVNIIPNVEIELPVVRNVRSELSVPPAEICNQESRSSHFSFGDFRNIDPDDFIDACANMPPKKRFLVKENMTPEKLQGRSYWQSHRASRDVGNSFSSMPELMMAAPSSVALSASLPPAVMNFSQPVVNNRNDGISLPEIASSTPKKIQEPSILGGHHETGHDIIDSSTVPELTLTVGTTTTVSAVVPVTVTDVSPVNNQDNEIADIVSVSKDNTATPSFVQETNTGNAEEAENTQPNLDILEQSSITKCTGTGKTATLETDSISQAESITKSVAQETNGESVKEPESTRHILDDLGMPEQGTRKSKRKTKSNIALKNLVPRPQSKSAKKSAKSNSSKKKGSTGNEKKIKKGGDKTTPTGPSKDKLIQPGQGRVMINLKNKSRMPIEVPGLIVAPENQSSISKEDIVKNLVSQLQQANSEKDAVALGDQTNIDLSSEERTPNKDNFCDANDSDALMIDESAQNAVLDEDYVANTVLQALTNFSQIVQVEVHAPPEQLQSSSSIASQGDYSPQVSDSNVQCEVEVQTAHDESIIPIISGEDTDNSRQIDVQTTDTTASTTSHEQHVAISHSQNYNEVGPSSHVSSSHHGLMMDANSFPLQESVFANDADSTRDRIRAFTGRSYSTELLDTNVPVLERYGPDLRSVQSGGGSLTTPQRPQGRNIFSTISPSSGIFSVINNESNGFSPKGKRNLASAKSNLLSSFLLENSTDRLPHTEPTPMDQSKIADLQQLLHEAEVDSQSTELSELTTGAKASKLNSRRASVKKTGGSGAIVSSQSKSMVRAEPKSHGASVVKRCLVQSSSAKDSRSRRTRSGRVFGTEKSNEKRAEKVLSPTQVIEKETDGNNVNVTPIPSKTDNENGTLKRKKPSKAKEKRKKPRHSAGYPAINWSYEEIQARLDAIHGKKDKIEVQNSPKSNRDTVDINSGGIQNKSDEKIQSRLDTIHEKIDQADEVNRPKSNIENNINNSSGNQNKAFEDIQTRLSAIHGKKRINTKDSLKSVRRKNLKNPIGNRNWSLEEIQAKLDAIHGKKDNTDRIDSPKLCKGANIENTSDTLLTETPSAHALNQDNERTVDTSDSRTSFEPEIHTNNKNQVECRDMSDAKSIDQSPKRSENHLHQQELHKSAINEEQNQTQVEQQNEPSAETRPVLSENQQELTSDRGIEIADNTNDSRPSPVTESLVKDLNASFEKGNRCEDLSRESEHRLPGQSMQSRSRNEQCESSRSDPRKPRRIKLQQIMTWDRPLPGWAAESSLANDTDQFPVTTASEGNTHNTSERVDAVVLDDNASHKTLPKTTEKRRKARSRSKKKSKFSLFEKQIKKMDISKFLDSLEYDKVS